MAKIIKQTKVLFCSSCNRKDSCDIICPDLKTYLKAGGDRASPLSSDYIDRTFPLKETTSFLGEKYYSYIDKKGREAKALIKHFTQFGVNGVLYYWIWMEYKKENYSQHDIARMLGLSQQRVSQIINIIRREEYK